MSTTLNNCRIELSKQLGDYWSGTTTGAGSATTVVDTALCAKYNDWITDNAYDFVVDMTSDTYNEQERKITSLDNTTGTLTVLAHGGALGSGATYEVHRLFTPSEKRIALVAACRDSFPYLFKEIRDETHISGNWLKDGSFEIWTASTTPGYWGVSALTATQTSTTRLFKHGSYSAKLTGATGNIYQNISTNEDLKKLEGKTVTFTVQGKSDASDSLRIGIYDGINDTLSSHMAQTNGWTADSAPLTHTATIDDNPSEVQFYICHDNVSATDYIDDARVISNDNPPIYIGNLGLNRNTAHQVLIESTSYSVGDSWNIIHNCQYDQTNGYLYLPDNVPPNLGLRILGIGALDFLSSGASSTAWTATVDVDQPQLDILIKQAILYLYTQMALPNLSTGDRKAFQEMISYWQQRLKDSVSRYRMIAPAATRNWSY